MEDAIEKHCTGGPSPHRWIPWNSEEPHPTVIHTLESKGVAAMKDEITMYYEQGKWDDYKKITNPYEYIFLSWNRRTSRSVATRSPLSRSYFKLIELWKQIDITKEIADLVKKEKGLHTSHSAEGPGGFLEAITVMAERLKWNYVSCTAMTLRSTNKHIPGWRKAATFLSEHPMVHITYGADDTGDILKRENQSHFVKSIPTKVHIYTADGGFDFSGDYSGQEDSIFALLAAEITLGLQTLAQGGVMIIKCFDTTEKQTLDLLWMVCECFREWSFLKPRTSRAGNAERYFVGKGFLGESVANEVVTLLHAAEPYKKGVPLLKNPYPKAWIQLMWEVQELIEKEEYRIIHNTIELIRRPIITAEFTPMIRQLVKQNVLHSIDWCKEHLESISDDWNFHLDRCVAQEVSDLLQILCPLPPVHVHRIPSWTVRSERTVPTFEQFRSSSETGPWRTVGRTTPQGEIVGGAASAALGPAATSSLPAEALQTDPPERFPRAPRRYADLFSRPRRIPVGEASSPIPLRGKFG